METLYVTKDAKLSADGRTLLVAQPDRPKTRVPIVGLKHVIIAGEAGLTTALLTLFGQSEVRVTVLDWHGNVSGCFEPNGSPASGRVRLLQAQHVMEEDKRLFLARSFVAGALRNILANLRYRYYRGSEGVGPHVKAIEGVLSGLESAKAIDELMGREGGARSWYYDAWKEVDVRLDFGKRVRRPPNNRINCLISWFNGLAYSVVRHELAKTHLDGCVSFLHSPYEARSSLALDVSEIFKPAVCDTLIMELVLRDRPRDDWFHEEGGVCRLSEVGRVATLEEWVRRLETRNGDEPSMRELMLDESLKLERHILGLGTYSPWRRRI